MLKNIVPYSASIMMGGKCAYRRELVQTRPEGHLRADYDLFSVVLETYQFHENGDISFTPDTESLAEYLLKQGK